MDKPTQEQIKEVWEWCGIKHRPDLSFGEHHGRWHDVYEYPDRTPTDVLPTLDLNNLFKYAVPLALKKLKEQGDVIPLTGLFGRWYNQIVKLSGSSSEVDIAALALFWTIWDVIKEKGGGRC